MNWTLYGEQNINFSGKIEYFALSSAQVSLALGTNYLLQNFTNSEKH